MCHTLVRDTSHQDQLLHTKVLQDVVDVGAVHTPWAWHTRQQAGRRTQQYNQQWRPLTANLDFKAATLYSWTIEVLSLRLLYYKACREYLPVCLGAHHCQAGGPPWHAGCIKICDSAFFKLNDWPRPPAAAKNHTAGQAGTVCDSYTSAQQLLGRATSPAVSRAQPPLAEAHYAIDWHRDSGSSIIIIIIKIITR